MARAIARTGGRTVVLIDDFQRLNADAIDRALFGTQFTFPIGSLTGTLRADYNRWGKKYWHPDNVDVRDPVEMLDLRASIAGERWTMTAWGRNVLDEFYWQDFNSVEFGAPGIDLGSQSQPDTFGVEFRYEF